MTRKLWILVVSSCLLVTGCSTMSESQFFGFGDEKEKASALKPTSVFAMWQDGVDMQMDPRQGGIVIPGFSGKVNLQSQKPGKPAETVEALGTLLVSFYPDVPQQPGVAQQPMETWKILPEHLPPLLKKDMSGWGYVLWLPWNTYNPNIQSGRLTVEFTAADGKVLRADPTPIKLNASIAANRPKLEVEHVRKNTWQ